MLQQEQQAREYKELLDNGFISRTEYMDLIEDLKREVGMIEAADAMEMKANCLKVLNTLSKII